MMTSIPPLLLFIIVSRGFKMDSHITEEMAALMQSHLELVIEANKTTNLTRIDSLEDGMLLHVEDSLVGLEECLSAPEGMYADLGTGGGFPGITIAIATGRITKLVDTRRKKTAILDGITEKLGLTDRVSTYTGRIEEMALEYPKAFSLITARALARLSVLLEFASPLLKQGGRLVCYKAQVSDEELGHALEVQRTLGMNLVSQRSVYLSDGGTFRTILSFEKIGNPRIKLPRPVSFAQKKPL